MEKLAIALGNFDGVHLGHQALLQRCVALKKEGYTPAALMFSEDPENCLAGMCVTRQITDNAQKEAIMKSMGIEKVIFMNFMENKDYSPKEFADMLKNKYNAAALICGFHYRFGKFAKGDATLLKRLATERGISFHKVEPVTVDNMLVSSTLIRGFIAEGNVEKAWEFLGRPFCVEAPVVEGKHLGRTLGFPTVNQRFEKNSVVPACGVYITNVYVDGVRYGGVSNVGLRPTVENTKECNIETNILDFDKDIYGKTVRVEFIKMLRKEKKFSDINQLAKAVSEDRETAISFFKNK